MTLVAPRRIPGTSRSEHRRLRCTLTGVPVGPRDVIYVERAQVKQRKPRLFQRESDVGVIAPPVTLHQRMPTSVGPEYSLMMWAYVGAIEREMRDEKRAFNRAEAQAVVAWWESRYGVKRVLRELRHRCYGRHVKLVEMRAALRMVLAMQRERAEPSDIAKRYHVPVSEVYYWNDRCMKMAGYHRMDCQCAECAPRKQGTR